MQMMDIDDKDLIFERFDANYQKLKIEPKIWQTAIKTIQKLNVNGALTNDSDDWLCCAVYSELQQTKMKDMRQDSNKTKRKDMDKHQERCNSWNISLTKLLRSFNMNVRKFIKRMDQWNCLAQNSDIFKQEVSELERRLAITLRLMQHYKRIFKQLYVYPESIESRVHYQMIYDFGWLLFLTVRNELPPSATNNLINGCQVLICALELVYVNALEVHKSDVINLKFQGVPLNWCHDDFDIDRLLKYSATDAICALIPELPKKGVRQMKNSFFHKAMMCLFLDQRLLGNDRVMRDLIKDDILEFNLACLNRSYAAHVSDISEFDERVLLHNDPHSTTSTTTKPLEQTGVELLSNCTLISSVANNWVDASQRNNLTKLLSQDLPQTLPVHISGDLSMQDTQVLQNSLRDMWLKFEGAVKLNQEAAECRFGLVKGLYYMLLDRIVAAELCRRPMMKSKQLLLQQQLRSFHATLTTCCLELVLYMFICKTQETSLQFPWLLNCFGIDPYEFQKVLELVVRHELGMLTPDLNKHLHKVGVQCLLSLIWHKNSPLWRLYATTGLPSYEHVQQSPSSSSAICLRKFYHLANQRLTYLCTALSLLDRYTQVWHVVEHSIVVHGAKLLQRRHLDQLLMCAVYLCVRKECLRITFCDIIGQYRRQPYAQSAIYRAVYLGDNQAETDIITFYNQVYVGLMAEYVRQLDCIASSHSNEHRPLQNLSRYIQLKSTRVFVSCKALPLICRADGCKDKSVMGTAMPNNLKRAHSNDDLEKATCCKRPNILRRRTTFQ